VPLTIAELRRQLSAIEPTESTYAGISPDEVPALEALLDDEEVWMAARAVHALARMDASQARRALRRASASLRPEVRVAVAAVAQSLPPRLSDHLLERLLDDPDPGVRKFAIRSVSDQSSESVRSRLRRKSTEEKDPVLRRLAGERADALKQ
jgi:HEAT repeat protein